MKFALFLKKYFHKLKYIIIYCHLFVSLHCVIVCNLVSNTKLTKKTLQHYLLINILVLSCI